MLVQRESAPPSLSLEDCPASLLLSFCLAMVTHGLLHSPSCSALLGGGAAWASLCIASPLPCTLTCFFTACFALHCLPSRPHFPCVTVSLGIPHISSSDHLAFFQPCDHDPSRPRTASCERVFQLCPPPPPYPKIHPAQIPSRTAGKAVGSPGAFPGGLCARRPSASLPRSLSPPSVYPCPPIGALYASPASSLRYL